MERGSESWRGLYSYRPYDWGPYSSQLASDLRHLTATECLDDARQVRHYGTYRTTVLGKKLIVDCELSDSEEDFIRRVRAYIVSQPFNQLLRNVYAAYPEYATESKFSG